MFPLKNSIMIVTAPGWIAYSLYHLFFSISSQFDRKIGLSHHFKTKALTPGVLCLPDYLSENEEPFSSCNSKKLKILILHNHCPLFTRSHLS